MPAVGIARADASASPRADSSSVCRLVPRKAARPHALIPSRRWHPRLGQVDARVPARRRGQPPRARRGRNLRRHRRVALLARPTARHAGASAAARFDRAEHSWPGAPHIHAPHHSTRAPPCAKPLGPPPALTPRTRAISSHGAGRISHLTRQHTLPSSLQLPRLAPRSPSRCSATRTATRSQTAAGCGSNTVLCGSPGLCSSGEKGRGCRGRMANAR